MTVYYIDLQGVGTKEQFHERLRGALPLPPYYGNNLDALHDVLEESGRDWELIFYNCGDADKALGGYMGALRAMCAETIASWEDDPQYRDMEKRAANWPVRFYD